MQYTFYYKNDMYPFTNSELFQGYLMPSVTGGWLVS